jgi:hypothetical protein
MLQTVAGALNAPFLDKTRFIDKGNEITLIKRREFPREAAPCKS